MDIQSEINNFDAFVKDKFPALATNKENGNYFANSMYESMLAAWLEAKAQAVPEGFVLVRKELPESIAETLALDRVAKPVGNEIDPIWIEITENVYKEHLRSKKWELWRDYKAMIEAQEPAND